LFFEVIPYLPRIVATRTHRTAQPCALIVRQFTRQQWHCAQVETNLHVGREILELDLEAGGGGGCGRVGGAEGDLRRRGARKREKKKKATKSSQQNK
jgi:hypothetical protein